MGRIKTSLIKRITLDLFRKHGDKFKKTFEDNRELVGQFADISSKKQRNIIAGYITRLVKEQE